MRKKIQVIGALACLLSCASCAATPAASSINGNNTATPSVVDASSQAPSSEVTPSSEAIPSSEEDNSVAEALSYQGAQGYIATDMHDFKQYEGTSAYRKVSNASELIKALEDARYEYTTTVSEVIGTGFVIRQNLHKQVNWERAVQKGLYVKNEDGTFTKLPADEPFSTYQAGVDYYEDSPLCDAKYTQELTKEGTVHVIEIDGDINMGYNVLSSSDKESSVVKSFGNSKNETAYLMSDMYLENGMTQIMVERTTNLLIYSKNGSKITHGGFKVNYCNNVAFRNLELDEMWQWEDSNTASSAKVGDYDAFGWAYFKIGYSDNVWIDHCTFGKSYDGQIDVSNPTYTTVGTTYMAPYQGDGSSSVHISWCKFTAGSDDKDGYIYKMMDKIEQSYLNGTCEYLYYKKLRDLGCTFEEILYGIAMPQKKAFLDGDSGDEYKYNKNLTVSIADCYFKNIEDRLPKVRTGNVYMYNSLIDNFEYYSYRETLLNKNVKSEISTINSSWKCALVSQGIVCGNGGSVMAENTIFRGIASLLKNNDSTLTNQAGLTEATYNGGFKLTNCTYQITEKNRIQTKVSMMTNATPDTLKESFFKWNTIDGEAPFTPKLYEISELEEALLNGMFKAGVCVNTNIDYLKSKY